MLDSRTPRTDVVFDNPRLRIVDEQAGRVRYTPPSEEHPSLKDSMRRSCSLYNQAGT